MNIIPELSRSSRKIGLLSTFKVIMYLPMNSVYSLIKFQNHGVIKSHNTQRKITSGF